MCDAFYFIYSQGFFFFWFFVYNEVKERKEDRKEERKEERQTDNIKCEMTQPAKMLTTKSDHLNSTPYSKRTKLTVINCVSDFHTCSMACVHLDSHAQ